MWDSTDNYLELRRDFCGLIDHFGFRRGAEIGAKLGNFSDALLKGSHLDILYSVDPWIIPPKTGKPDREAHYRQCVKRLRPHGKRSQIIRKHSHEAAKDFAPGSLDFVYIDGGHGYFNVKRDLQSWWPVVRSGGVISGHDYCNDEERKFGVARAVDEFLQEHPEIEALYLTGTRGPASMQLRREIAQRGVPGKFGLVRSWWFFRP